MGDLGRKRETLLHPLTVDNGIPQPRAGIPVTRLGYDVSTPVRGGFHAWAAAAGDATVYVDPYG